MYIRCHCYMFRPHMGHLQATLIVWGHHCTVHFVLSTLGTSLLMLLLLLLFSFVGYLHPIFFSCRFSVPFYRVVHFSCVCLVLFVFLVLVQGPYLGLTVRHLRV
jgi:hypothetical protein